MGPDDSPSGHHSQSPTDVTYQSVKNRPPATQPQVRVEYVPSSSTWHKSCNLWRPRQQNTVGGVIYRRMVLQPQPWPLSKLWFLCPNHESLPHIRLIWPLPITLVESGTCGLPLTSHHTEASFTWPTRILWSEMSEGVDRVGGFAPPYFASGRSLAPCGFGSS